MAANEQQRLDLTLAPALHQFALRAVGTVPTFVFVPTDSNAAIKAGIEGLAAYAGYTCTVTGTLTTSVDADTGETLYSGSKTVAFSPTGDVPELEVLESEEKHLILTNVTGNGTANGATIHPGDTAGEVQTALRGTGGDYANVVVAGSSDVLGGVDLSGDATPSGTLTAGTPANLVDNNTGTTGQFVTGDAAVYDRGATPDPIDTLRVWITSVVNSATLVFESATDLAFTSPTALATWNNGAPTGQWNEYTFAANSDRYVRVRQSAGAGSQTIREIEFYIAGAADSDGEYALHFPYSVGNVAAMTVVGTGYSKNELIAGLAASSRITVLVLQEGSSGGSTVGATRGFGAGGGTADQAHAVMIQEATPGTLDTGGTPVYATDVEGEGAALNRIQAFAQHIPEGMLDPLSFAQIGLEGELSWDWRPQYSYIPRRMANLFGATSSDTNDGTTRTRVWKKLNQRINSVFMESTFYGVEEEAFLLLRGAIQNLSMSVARNANAGTVGGNISLHYNDVQRNKVFIGGTNELQRIIKTGTLTGGTYTLTVTNPDTGETDTTSAIAYNADATAIQSAIDALDNVEPGDIVVTGGPVSAAYVQFEFSGRFAVEDITLIDVDDALTVGGTIASNTQTPGVVPTAPTIYDSAFIEADHTRVYFATDDTDLATIDYASASDPHIVTDILGHEWNMGPLWSPLYTENRSRNPSSKVAVARREYGLSLTVPKEATGTCEDLYAEEEGCTTAKRWVVFAHKCGSYEWRLAFWVSRADAESYGADNNLPIRTFPFRLIFNPNGTANIISTFINPLADAF